MSLPEILIVVYLGLGVIWFLWFQIQKDSSDIPADTYFGAFTRFPLVQLILIPLWPIWLVAFWPKKPHR